MTNVTPLTCACGQVRIEVEGTPILSPECHCNSCREAGGRLQRLPGAPSVLEANGGTHFVLYRKDRVRFLEGMERLASFRLKPEAKTRRVVATCCNTPVFLDLVNAHWLSVFGLLWPEGVLPPVELRVTTSDLPDPTVLPDDVPNAKRISFLFFRRVLGAWIAMGFRIPKVPFGEAELEA